MLCTHVDIADFVRRGYVEGAKEENINATSLDVTLGKSVILEGDHGTYANPHLMGKVDLATREGMKTMEIDIPNGLLMDPGMFVLGQTVEKFNMPDWLSAEFKLKSSLARMGLEHLTACWIDPGFNGSVLTLELKNMLRHHRLLLKPGMLIGQIVFYQHNQISPEFSYRRKGRYNGLETVSGALKRSEE